MLATKFPVIHTKEYLFSRHFPPAESLPMAAFDQTRSLLSQFLTSTPRTKRYPRKRVTRHTSEHCGYDQLENRVLLTATPTPVTIPGISTTGQVLSIAAPPTVELQKLESDSFLHLIPERSQALLPTSIRVDVSQPGAYSQTPSMTPTNRGRKFGPTPV